MDPLPVELEGSIENLEVEVPEFKKGSEKDSEMVNFNQRDQDLKVHISISTELQKSILKGMMGGEEYHR